MTTPEAAPPVRLTGAAMRAGDRELWSRLNLTIAPGEFVAVLGPNGSGKTSLVKALLGQRRLDEGTVELFGAPARRGDRRIGYIPQQKLVESGVPVRARDVVGFGLAGSRWGLPLLPRRDRDAVDRVLASVGALDYADAPFGSLSGGEQQRVRVAQAVAGDVRLLLCDEPLLSLDPQHQHEVSDLIDAKRRELGAAVIFVTHDVNPVLEHVDRVLYLANGRFSVGRPDAVLRSEVLSSMYNTPIEVIRSRGRVIVIGSPEGYGVHDHFEHHLRPGRS